MAYIQGFRGTVQINTSTLHITRWQVHIRMSIIDVTNFVYFDFAAYAASLKDAEVTMDAIYDTDDDPFNINVDPNVRPGNNIAATFVFDGTGVGNNAQWDFPSLVVLSVRHSHVVRDVSRFTITARPLIESSADVPLFPINT